ncbi:uncharacterized protein CLUP02_06467 [Colletotrichum lupini]|uniref:Uncharacterized protein n=1 Tax=Colletotrichum lupini TaxID=145971 RepID=A0A9Q8SQF1_9PEZI|nr:uncharacterized protein CLUP02_06467 [Colletotrichum lupini]UQC80981.1 hypothetical protein CLUP02_06467 [Colletotrichum lupini]
MHQPVSDRHAQHRPKKGQRHAPWTLTKHALSRCQTSILHHRTDVELTIKLRKDQAQSTARTTISLDSRPKPRPKPHQRVNEVLLSNRLWEKGLTGQIGLQLRKKEADQESPIVGDLAPIHSHTPPLPLLRITPSQLSRIGRPPSLDTVQNPHSSPFQPSNQSSHGGPGPVSPYAAAVSANARAHTHTHEILSTPLRDTRLDRGSPGALLPKVQLCAPRECAKEEPQPTPTAG